MSRVRSLTPWSPPLRPWPPIHCLRWNMTQWHCDAEEILLTLNILQTINNIQSHFIDRSLWFESLNKMKAGVCWCWISKLLVRGEKIRMLFCIRGGADQWWGDADQNCWHWPLLTWDTWDTCSGVRSVVTLRTLETGAAVAGEHWDPAHQSPLIILSVILCSPTSTLLTQHHHQRSRGYYQVLQVIFNKKKNFWERKNWEKSLIKVSNT